MDRKNKPPEWISISLRVDLETYDAFRLKADANHRSMASELRRLVEAHVATDEQKEAA